MKKNRVAANIWLKKAKDDFNFAKVGWKESKIISVTCVLCQQAVEKALKSLLELENIGIDETPTLKTHRLRNIIKKCEEYYPEIAGFTEECKRLTPFYFDRYPADIPLNLTEEDAAFALETADKILKFVEEIISKV